MTSLYECGSCGVVSEAGEHLCQPQRIATHEEVCTLPVRDICDTMHRTLSYECASCGRPAESKELLCDPHKIR